MSKVYAINGSPMTDRGDTAVLLAPFIQGMEDAGADVELVYASRLNLKPCSCGRMYCWYENPGNCCIKDEMQPLYPKLKDSDILVLATPVYIPLPGRMQDFINRLCPLIEPMLENYEGRTRARLRKDVGIQKFVLLATGGWWEIQNFDTLIHIVKELADNAHVEFAGAVVRPHAFLMKSKGVLTKDGVSVLDEARKAGCQLVKEGAISLETLDKISRPLITEEELRRRYNQAL